MQVLNLHCVYYGTELQTPIQPRHPEAAYAILFTGISAFGGLTAGPRSQTGLRSLTPNELGLLFKQRTALGARNIKALPDTTDAPNILLKVTVSLTCPATTTTHFAPTCPRHTRSRASQ